MRLAEIRRNVPIQVIRDGQFAPFVESVFDVHRFLERVITEIAAEGFATISAAAQRYRASHMK